MTENLQTVGLATRAWPSGVLALTRVNCLSLKTLASIGLPLILEVSHSTHREKGGWPNSAFPFWKYHSCRVSSSSWYGSNFEVEKKTIFLRRNKRVREAENEHVAYVEEPRCELSDQMVACDRITPSMPNGFMWGAKDWRRKFGTNGQRATDTASNVRWPVNEGVNDTSAEALHPAKNHFFQLSAPFLRVNSLPVYVKSKLVYLCMLKTKSVLAPSMYTLWTVQYLRATSSRLGRDEW